MAQEVGGMEVATMASGFGKCLQTPGSFQANSQMLYIRFKPLP